MTKENQIQLSDTHQQLSRLAGQEAHTEKNENLRSPSLPLPQTHEIAALFLLRNNQKILWDQPLLLSHPPPPPPQLPPQLQLAGLELEEVEVEPHLGEVPRMQMLRTLAMPLTQPYIEQGLGLHLEGASEEDPEDLEDLEEVHLCQSRLHTWFQSQQTLMCTLWAHRPGSSMETDDRPTPLLMNYSHTYAST